MILQFANEFPSRIAPLLRMPAIVDMSPRERQTANLYMEEVRDYLPNAKLLKGRALHRLFMFVIKNLLLELCCISILLELVLFIYINVFYIFY